MITIVLAVAAACGVFSVAYFAADFGVGWSIFWGVLGFGVFQGVVGYFIRKRMQAEMAKVQEIMVAGQNKLKEKTQRWQIRPPGSVQAAQKEMMEDMKVFVGKALEQTEALRKFKPYVPMMERQIATARLQLCWMIKDFKAVDEAMPKVLFVDPNLAAMKMARMYMRGEDLAAIRKVYEKAVARVKYNGNVLLAATMSWMQVKKGDADGAFKTLTEALKKSDNATLRQNHQTLMNNRVAHFTNSGIGDQWYSLYLEEPRVRMQRQHINYR